MVNISLFKEDLKIEGRLSIWLDRHFYSDTRIIENFLRTNQMSLQHKGVDIELVSKVIFGDNNRHIVDEKAAIKYVKKNPKTSSLQSFAFELDYFKGTQLKEGWLYNTKYNLTEFYLIMWLWADVDEMQNGKYTNYNWRQINDQNISKVEGIFLDKKIIREYAKSLDVTTDKFSQLRFLVSAEKSSRLQLDDGTSITVSNQLSERPMNLVIKKNRLIELATYHFEKYADEIKDTQNYSKQEN